MNKTNIVTFSVLLIGTVSILVAVAGNALVLAVIWRNPSLRTSSYILLAVLVSTDFLTGMTTQPFYVASKFTEIRNGKPQSFCITTGTTAVAVEGIGSYLVLITLLTTTFMAIERRLHMARRSLLNVRRVCMICSIILIVPVPFVAFRIQSIMECHQLNDIDVATSVAGVVCLTIASVAYFKVYGIILRHRQHVRANEPTQNFGQPAIHLVKYKRSVCTILCILALFYVTYIPLIVFTIVLSSLNEITDKFSMVFNALIGMHLLSSSLNPVLYCLRMKNIRDGVKQIVKRIVCNN